MTYNVIDLERSIFVGHGVSGPCARGAQYSFGFGVSGRKMPYMSYSLNNCLGVIQGKYIGGVSEGLIRGETRNADYSHMMLGSLA